MLLLAAALLTACASMRGAEYDEQYTLFLTAGTARPVWPRTEFPAGTIAAIQSGHASLTQIAHDLRTTDVHPPLYFWAVSLWRSAIGLGLFPARLFSILCGLIALAATGVIARNAGIRPEPAMLLTLGSYGFVYTSVIARGFAPAQALTLCGVALLTGARSRTRTLIAEVLLGAATSCNYLAVFVAATIGILAGGWLILPGALPFLALDAWFFAAQHGARTGQFPPFSLLSALPRLAGYQAAAILGGLPLSLTGAARSAASVAIGLLALALVAVIIRVRPLSDPRLRLLAAAALAPAAGLLALGAIFNNTPIELRYLAFSTPFIAMLIAWACPKPLLLALGSVQCASIAGLAIAAATMQPAHYTAHDAARLGANAITLVPRGNDGVGIVGAFGLEAPPTLPILLVDPAETPADLRHRTEPYNRIILALLAQDRDSTATVQLMHKVFAPPDWRQVATGFNIQVYERTTE